MRDLLKPFDGILVGFSREYRWKYVGMQS